MKLDRLLEEIRETNLAYLLLAQQMLRQDKAAAMFRLGVSQDLADILENLSAAQILKIAGSNMLLCRFRFDDRLILDMLTGYSKERIMAGAHTAIRMAGQPVEAMA